MCRDGQSVERHIRDDCTTIWVLLASVVLMAHCSLVAWMHFQTTMFAPSSTELPGPTDRQNPLDADTIGAVTADGGGGAPCPAMRARTVIVCDAPV